MGTTNLVISPVVTAQLTLENMRSHHGAKYNTVLPDGRRLAITVAVSIARPLKPKSMPGVPESVLPADKPDMDQIDTALRVFNVSSLDKFHTRLGELSRLKWDDMHIDPDELIREQFKSFCKQHKLKVNGYLYTFFETFFLVASLPNHDVKRALFRNFPGLVRQLKAFSKIPGRPHGFNAIMAGAFGVNYVLYGNNYQRRRAPDTPAKRAQRKATLHAHWDVLRRHFTPVGNEFFSLLVAK